LCSLQPPPTTQIYTLSYTTLFRSHAVRQDESAGAGGQDHVDGPRGEVLGDDGPEPLREGGLGGDQGLLDVLARVLARGEQDVVIDRKSTRLNSSHDQISYAVFCLK